MKQEIRTLIIGDEYTLQQQLQALIDDGFEIVSMVVTESGGYSQISQYADKVVVVLNNPKGLA